MRVTIFKYRNSDGSIPNLFQTSPTAPFIDKIILNEILVDGFPVYNEEYTSQSDIFQIVSSDFEIKLSVFYSERSILGKNIKEFLLPDNISERKNLFVVVIEFAPPNGKVIAGTIDLNTIEINNSLNNDGFKVKISLFGLMKQLIERMSEVYLSLLPAINGSISFDQYLSGIIGSNWYLFFPNQYVKINLNNNLNIQSKCGGNVLISNYLQREILGNYKGTGTPIHYISVWQLLKEFMLALGFTFKIETFINDNSNWAGVNLVLQWRSNGQINPEIINMIEEVETYEPLWANENVFVLCEDYGNSQPLYGNDGTEGRDGVIFIGNYHQFVGVLEIFPLNAVALGVIGDNNFANGAYFTFSNRYPNIPFNFSINQKLCKIIDLSTYEQNIIQQNINGIWFIIPNLKIPLSRMLVFSYSSITPLLHGAIYHDDGNESIMTHTAGNEYRILIQGLTKMKKLKIHFDITSKLEVTQQVSYKNQNWWVERIRDVDLFNKTANIDLIEVIQ